jgi:hypothetical protein
VLLRFFVPALKSVEVKMIFQLNLAAIVAVAGQAVWKQAKPAIFKDVVILPWVFGNYFIVVGYCPCQP